MAFYEGIREGLGAELEREMEIILQTIARSPLLYPRETEQAVLLRRLEDFRKNPESFLTWEQVKVQLAEQRARKRA
ncbi:MAG TPA: addiction module protein [Phycisphaerae bacterium]|nr:addiction module protein [Phycisphaerae bacterium]